MSTPFVIVSSQSLTSQVGGGPSVLTKQGFNNFDFKESCRAATTDNKILTDTLETQIDGIDIISGNRVLIKSQDNASENGIYVLKDNNKFERADDYNLDTAVHPGNLTYIEEGTINATKYFVLTTTNPISVGQTELTFNELSVNASIDNDSITNEKLSNMTRGTIKVGGVSNTPTDRDAKTSGYILVGDGTDILSVEVTGDVTMANTGDITVKQSAFSSTDANAGYRKITSATDGTPNNTDSILARQSDNTLFWADLAAVCFLKGTKITLPDYSQKNIEDLTLADDVLTYNIDEISNIKDKNVLKNVQLDSMNGKISQSGIRNIWINPTDSYLIINDKLKVTKNHIIHFKRDNQHYFRFADHLTIGDELMNDKEVYESVEDIKEIHEKTNVYNFELDKDNTYFAENYLVHHYCELCSGYSKII